ncbi:MAG: energy transducer TonB [Leptospiraceae bacterium]|nr:energy transducer TonB [Leptospiraceae bacterium]MDW7975782.1 energy transducer TonB [Leptospiraceae bacterium]
MRVNKSKRQVEKNEFIFLKYAIVVVLLPFFSLLNALFLPSHVSILLEQLNLESSIVKNFYKVYPVIVEHFTYAPFRENQIPVYSYRTSGGKGGITKEYGFHTLTNSDTFLVSYSLQEKDTTQPIQKGVHQNQQTTKSSNKTEKTGFDEEIYLKKNYQKKQDATEDKSSSENSESKLPTKIPANYRFRNDFSLRWDDSPDIAIASVELKGYKYFRDMLRQIRDNFSPPGLNLVWRDSAGVVISQPIKPQVVRVLFLLDYDGTVRDARIVSSMGQKPVDEACIRALLNQNFGTPPPEVFEHGNIFGINFVFPPLH